MLGTGLDSEGCQQAIKTASVLKKCTMGEQGGDGKPAYAPKMDPGWKQ